MQRKKQRDGALLGERKIPLNERERESERRRVRDRYRLRLNRVYRLLCYMWHRESDRKI